MRRSLKGESREEADAEGTGSVGEDWLQMTEQRHAAEESLYGYCTEVLVSGAGLDPDSIREHILTLGDSVLVVGDDKLVRVHVHTDDPGAALSHGTSVGSLVQVKVDNIRRQAEQFVEMHEDRQGKPVGPGAVCTVAIVVGEGMAEVFESVGCTRVISGGPTMNPSTKDILDAVEGCPSDDVVVLPNDKNIIMAAQQAVGLTKKHMVVVPTRSMPQGIAALLAMSPEEGLEENALAMEEGRQLVRTVEVTRAVRTTKIGGVKVETGDCIAIVDDELTFRRVPEWPPRALELRGQQTNSHALLRRRYLRGTNRRAGGEPPERLTGYDVKS
jgi:dihydroxyacetone kinase-like predicted kinase